MRAFSYTSCIQPPPKLFHFNSFDPVRVPQFIQHGSAMFIDSFSFRSSILDRALELPDGTMVIPIDDEEEDEIANGKPVNTGSHIEKVTANEEEIAVANFDEDEDSFENEPESTRSHNTQGSVCSLSTKFGQQQNRPKNHDTLATVTSSTYGATSEDRSSIISLSDKYRQQVNKSQ